MNLRIGVDIDGVIIDFVGSFLRTISRVYGRSLTHDDVFCHDFSQVLGLPRTEVGPLIDRTIEENGFDLIPGSVEALVQLSRAGHEIVLVTSRPAKYLAKTEQILKKHGVPYREIVFAGFLDKHTKSSELDVIIEDSLEEAISLTERNFRVLLMSQPWNRHTANVRGLLTVVQDWQETLAALLKTIQR